MLSFTLSTDVSVLLAIPGCIYYIMVICEKLHNRRK